jgi:hypothetical protein
MADGPPTSALDQTAAAFIADVRMQADDHHLVPASMVYPLLGAVEAVLKPHQPGRVTIFGHLCKLHKAHRDFSITAREADDVRACPDCTATVYASCAGCGPQVSVNACRAREAIARELTKGGTP